MSPRKPALDAGRLLVLSPFSEKATRTTNEQAQGRNEFVVRLARAVLIPHATPGGQAEASARQVIESGKPLFSLDCEEDMCLFQNGTRPYDAREIGKLLSSACGG